MLLITANYTTKIEASYLCNEIHSNTTEVVMHTEHSLTIGNRGQCIYQTVSNGIELSHEHP